MKAGRRKSAIVVYTLLSIASLCASAALEADFGASFCLVTFQCVLTAAGKTFMELSFHVAAKPYTGHAGQLPGERQRFRVLGASRTYTTSTSWVEVSYSDLCNNGGKVLVHLPPGATPLAVVQGNGYGHGETILTCPDQFSLAVSESSHALHVWGALELPWKQQCNAARKLLYLPSFFGFVAAKHTAEF